MSDVSIPLAFIAGLVSFVSPCFLPVVPVFLAYLTGGEQKLVSTQVPVASGSAGGFLTAADRAAMSSRGARGEVDVPRRLTRRLALMNTAAFVAAFSVVFIGIWLGIALFGFALGSAMHWVRLGAGIVVLTFGLSMLGWLKIPGLETTWRPLERFIGGEATPWNSALLGLAFGAGWSPCIGPVLGAIIMLALGQGTMWAGTMLLVVYSLGLGLPLFLLVGLTGAKPVLTWLSKHQKGLRIAAGIMLILAGFLLIADLWAPLSGLLGFGL